MAAPTWRQSFPEMLCHSWSSDGHKHVNRQTKLCQYQLLSSHIDDLVAYRNCGCSSAHLMTQVRESDVLKEKWPIFDVCPLAFQRSAEQPAFSMNLMPPGPFHACPIKHFSSSMNIQDHASWDSDRELANLASRISAQNDTKRLPFHLSVLAICHWGVANLPYQTHGGIWSDLALFLFWQCGDTSWLDIKLYYAAHYNSHVTAQYSKGRRWIFYDFCWVYPRAFKTHPARCELRQAFHVDLDSWGCDNNGHFVWLSFAVQRLLNPKDLVALYL